MGRFGLLSAKLSSVHSKHASPHASSLVQSISSFVVLAVLMMAGLDPVTQIYAWGATAGTLGYMLILSLTCISVVVFFNRTKADRRIWNVVVAPIGGLVGIVICLWIALANLPAMVGGDGAQQVAAVLEGIVALTFLGGVLSALYLKYRRPANYLALKGLA